MIFMALVGGLGTYEGPIIGAVIFFLIETFFGGSGVWYLVGLGAAALLFSLFLPRGLWGALQDRFGLRLIPVGYRLRFLDGGPSTEGSVLQSENGQRDNVAEPSHANIIFCEISGGNALHESSSRCYPRKAFADMSIETLTLEEPRNGEILVRLVATGVCHTDIAHA